MTRTKDVWGNLCTRQVIDHVVWRGCRTHTSGGLLHEIIEDVLKALLAPGEVSQVETSRCAAASDVAEEERSAAWSRADGCHAKRAEEVEERRKRVVGGYAEGVSTLLLLLLLALGSLLARCLGLGCAFVQALGERIVGWIVRRVWLLRECLAQESVDPHSH